MAYTIPVHCSIRSILKWIASTETPTTIVQSALAALAACLSRHEAFPPYSINQYAIVADIAGP